MMQFKIKPEYYDMWGAYDGNDTVTADQINEMAAEWEMSVEELMKQVDEA